MTTNENSGSKVTPHESLNLPETAFKELIKNEVPQCIAAYRSELDRNSSTLSKDALKLKNIYTSQLSILESMVNDYSRNPGLFSDSMRVPNPTDGRYFFTLIRNSNPNLRLCFTTGNLDMWKTKKSLPSESFGRNPAELYTVTQILNFSPYININTVVVTPPSGPGEQEITNIQSGVGFLKKLDSENPIQGNVETYGFSFLGQSLHRKFFKINSVNVPDSKFLAASKHITYKASFG